MVRETVGSEATWAVDSMVGSAPPQRPPGGPHPAENQREVEDDTGHLIDCRRPTLRGQRLGQLAPEARRRHGPSQQQPTRPTQHPDAHVSTLTRG